MPFKKAHFALKLRSGYLIGLLAFALIFVIAVGGGGYTPQLIWSNQNFALLALMLIGLLIQGTTEEIVCRGYVQGRLTATCGAGWAIALSALFFACGHLGNDGVPWPASGVWGLNRLAALLYGRPVAL